MQQDLKLFEGLALNFCKPESLNSSNDKPRDSWCNADSVSVGQVVLWLYTGENVTVMTLLSS